MWGQDPQKFPRELSPHKFLVFCQPLPFEESFEMADEKRAPSEDSFEFVETPAAPSPVPETQDYGVRTTSVCIQQHWGSAKAELFADLLPLVCVYQECTVASGRSWQRDLQQPLPLHTAGLHTRLLCVAAQRRSDNMAYPSYSHSHSHPDGVLDGCIFHVTPPQRESAISGSSSRALPHVQE